MLTSHLADRHIYAVVEYADGSIQSFDGLATSITISQGGGTIMPTASVVIHGLSVASISRLTSIKWQTKDGLRNKLVIKAKSGGSYADVYVGNITFAQPNFATAPNVSITISSMTAILDKTTPLPSYSAKGKQRISDLAQQIASQAGYIAEIDAGITKELVNPYLTGSAIDRLRYLALMGDADMYVNAGIIAMTPKGQPRQNMSHYITPQTGLIGYPSPTMIGVECDVIYHPSIRFGGVITIDGSVVEPCNGTWRVFGLQSRLDANIPDGQWQSHILAASIASGAKIAG